MAPVFCFGPMEGQNGSHFEKPKRPHGAKTALFFLLCDAICTEQMSDERKDLVKVRTMVIIYIMVYSQSQRCNSFQIALSRTLQQFGISERGLESLRNLGITAHPRTVKAQSKLSSSFHSDTVQSFIESAIENEQLLIFLIDDYHNIHTQHRPEAKKQTQDIHMTTLLFVVKDVIIMIWRVYICKIPVSICMSEPDIKGCIHTINVVVS